MSIRSISFQRNILKYYKKSALNISYFSSQASNNETNAIFVHTYPGSRVLELAKANHGNLITYEVSAIMNNKLDSYVNNKAISAVFLTSESTELFSDGIDLKNFQSLEQKKLTIDSIQKLARTISTYKKPILSVFNGLSNGSSFGTFAGSMFRLGTPSTKFRISELSNGIIPIGGLAYHFGKGSKIGVSMARYLAISERVIYSNDLYSLGLLTHLVEEQPHDSLAHAFAHTFPSDDDLANGEVVEKTALKELLDTMDITDPTEINFDIMSDPAWNKVLIVPIQKTIAAEVDKFDLKEMQSIIQECFSNDDLLKCKKKLVSIKQKWADDLVIKMDTINQDCLKNWFALTRLGETATLESVYKEELKICTK